MNEEDLQKALLILQDRDIDLSNHAYDISMRQYKDKEIYEICINGGRSLLYGKCPKCSINAEIIEVPDVCFTDVKIEDWSFYPDILQCVECFYKI